MARVLFIQEVAFDVLGVMYLSGYAKSKGHEVDILIQSEEKKNFFPKIKEFNPDAVAFSITVGYQIHYLNLAQKIKDMIDAKVIFGGPHCTIKPDLINHPQVDALCRGEGEEAFVEFLDALDGKTDLHSIPNLLVSYKGKIVENEIRPAEENLDRYSPADRSIYYKYKFLRNKTLKTFLSSRGCPYNCNFCFNHVFMDIYKNKNKIIRRTSPAKMVEEICECKEKYPLENLYFDDDLFIVHKKWLAEFAPLYKKHVGLPFGCNVHANMVNEEIVKLLKEAGCYLIMWGIESGNEKIRFETLNKRITDKQIYMAADLFHKYDLKMKCYNIMGIPGETFAQALQTMKLNAEIKVDFPWCNLMQAIPGVKIYDIAKSMGVLTENFSEDKLPKSTGFFDVHIKQPGYKRVARLHKLFYFGVKYPKTIPFLVWLTKFRMGIIYKMIFELSFSYRFMKETQISLPALIRIILRYIKLT